MLELSAEPMIHLIALVMLGLTIGSFLNVCIYRMPIDKSVVTPRSFCPSCNTPVSAKDNIPVLSYLILGGRCRACRSAISVRYPMIEILNAALYALVYLRTGMGWHLPVYLALTSSLIVITFIDLDHQIIPDEITLAGIGIGFVAASFILPDPFDRGIAIMGWKQSLIGAGVGFSLFYLVAVAGSFIFKQDAMGGGDIKFMAMAGAFLGWKGVLMTTFLGSLFGSIIGIVVMRLKGTGRKTVLPFGPFLAIAVFITLLWGHEIMVWWRPE